MLLIELFLIEAKDPELHYGMGWYNPSTGENISDNSTETSHLMLVLKQPEKFNISPDEVPEHTHPNIDDWLLDFDGVYAMYHQRAYRAGWVRWRLRWNGSSDEAAISGTKANVIAMLSTQGFTRAVKDMLQKDTGYGADLSVDTIDPTSSHSAEMHSMIEFNKLRRELS